MIRVLGLDPGLAETGWGVVAYSGSSIRYLSHGSIRTTPRDPLEIRLKIIYEGLTGVISEWKPQAAAVEVLFFAKNTSSAIPVAHTRGVLMLCCAIAGLPVFEYTPNEMKQAVVGSGRAEKEQVQAMVRLILGLAELPKPHHAADALAAAICHCHGGALSKGLT